MPKLDPRAVACFALTSGLLAGALVAQDSARVRVEIEGVSPELERNVLAVLQLARAAGSGKLSHQNIARLHHRAEADIETALRPFGFYRPTVEKWLDFANGQWVARYDITPGPPVTVKSITIDLCGPGAEAPEFQHLIAAFPLHQGDTLRDLRYEGGKLAFLTAATDSGYLDADFDTTAVLVDRTAGTAEVLLRFNTGPRYRFGPVHFEQNILDEDFLRTRVRFKEGRPFQQFRLQELQTALAEDPYFIRVEVMPQRKAARDLEVPIEVALEPRKRWSQEFGLGYGTDTGPRGRSNSMWRWVNRSGHYADAEIVLSQIQQMASARYNIPGIGHSSGLLSLLGGWARDNPRIGESRTALGAARLFRKRLGWRETISLSYQRSRFQIGVDSASSHFLVAGGSYERTRADSRIFPRHGIKSFIEVQGAQKALLSTGSFLQLRGSTKVIVGFLPKTRLLARAELGYTFTRHFHELPPTMRFFTGGDVSVRGFSYLKLAPRDSLGEVIGGRALMLASAEVDYQLLPSWAVAVFSDVGNAADRFGFRDLAHSVGAGIRFLSPIGMLRIDAALGISRQHPPFRLHFTMGQDL